MATKSQATRDTARSRQKLTVDWICDDLGISRRTFYEWRAKGRAPRCIQLPNGELRVTSDEYDRWWGSLGDVA